MGLTNYICLQCGKDFYRCASREKYGRAKYCSKKCHYEALKIKLSKPKDIFVCPVCSKKFQKKIYKKSYAVYCSPKCAYKGRSLGFTKRQITKPYNCKRIKPKICFVCTKEFFYKKKTQKYCSRKCYNIARKTLLLGKNNPAYKDGSSYNKREWRGNNWKTLRQEIYQRDNYTCQDCGIKCIGKRDGTFMTHNKIIQCHHIEDYKINYKNDKNNLITLCLGCHLKRHYGKKGGDIDV